MDKRFKINQKRTPIKKGLINSNQRKRNVNENY